MTCDNPILQMRRLRLSNKLEITGLISAMWDSDQISLPRVWALHCVTRQPPFSINHGLWDPREEGVELGRTREGNGSSKIAQPRQERAGSDIRCLDSQSSAPASAKDGPRSLLLCRVGAELWDFQEHDVLSGARMAEVTMRWNFFDKGQWNCGILSTANLSGSLKNWVNSQCWTPSLPGIFYLEQHFTHHRHHYYPPGDWTVWQCSPKLMTKIMQNLKEMRIRENVPHSALPTFPLVLRFWDMKTNPL